MRHAGWTLIALAACSPPPPEPPLPPMDRVALGSESGAARGSIDGARFTARDVRFRAVDGPHRRRVDLFFADRHIERCGLPIARPQTRLVWIRFPHRRALEPGLFTRDAHGGPLEVHYEHHDGRGFVAVHRGVARVQIDRVAPETVTGRMRVCFADTAHSCVGGAFEARPCWSRIDGRAIREPPGLSDEALEDPP